MESLPHLVCACLGAILSLVLKSKLGSKLDPIAEILAERQKKADRKELLAALKEEMEAEQKSV